MPDNFGVHNWIDCLPTEIREIVHGCMRKRQLAPQEVLFHAGEVAEALYQVVKGEIESSIVSPDGKELILYITYPGDCFGDASLVTGSPRFYTASARHASEVLVLPAGQFARLRAKHPEINHPLLRTQSKAPADYIDANGNLCVTEFAAGLWRVADPDGFVPERIWQAVRRLAAECQQGVKSTTGPESHRIAQDRYFCLLH